MRNLTDRNEEHSPSQPSIARVSSPVCHSNHTFPKHRESGKLEDFCRCCSTAGSPEHVEGITHSGSTKEFLQSKLDLLKYAVRLTSEFLMFGTLEDDDWNRLTFACSAARPRRSRPPSSDMVDYSSFNDSAATYRLVLVGWLLESLFLVRGLSSSG